MGLFSGKRLAARQAEEVNQMLSARAKESTRREWRDLGFFYDSDETAKAWLIVGDRTGLLKFSGLIRKYAADDSNASVSEHEHFGPYSYLEVGTWHEPQINGHWIAGTLPELAGLAVSLEEAISKLKPDERASIGKQFAPDSDWDLIVEMRQEPFDPPAADPNCA